MGMCGGGGGGGGSVSVPEKSQEEKDLMRAQQQQLERQRIQLEQDKADRALLEPYILKNMKLKKNTIGGYVEIPALLDPNGPASRENLNPDYFNTEDEKDAFILSALSLDREKKAARGELPVPVSVEQDIAGQKQNLLQNLEERYGKRYLESTGGSKGLLDFESNAAGLREKIRTGRATESADISSKMMSNYLRPRGYDYEMYSPNAGATGYITSALTPYQNQARNQFEDSYMGGYIQASDRAARYNLAGSVIGAAAGYKGSSSGGTKKTQSYSGGSVTYPKNFSSQSPYTYNLRG